MENKSQNKITILGSANYDSFIFVERSPEMGETLSGSALKTACGGKGANQAASTGRLGYEVDFVGQVGKDSSGETLLKNLKEFNVNIEHVNVLEHQPTGQAFILSYPNKDNSIIIIGGANMDWKGNNLEYLKKSLSTSKFLLLQREIPEEINISGCKIGKQLGVKIILDAGGEDKDLSKELLSLVDILSPNETELKRLVKRNVDIHDIEDIKKSLEELRKISGNHKLCLLLKLGSKGCLYIDENNLHFVQGSLNFEDLPIVDTTGAGDCFTAAFATQISEGKDIPSSLKFATGSAYLCITKFGAMPSLPDKEEVENLLKRI